MSFDDLLDDDKKEKEKKKKAEITDPKLMRLMRRRSSTGAPSRDPPSIVLLKTVTNRPHKTVKMVVDGVEQKPQNDVIDIYKCNKCGGQFNHTQYQSAMGIMPACPKCDK